MSAAAGLEATDDLARENSTACFTAGWRIDSIEATTLDSLTDANGIPAWLIALTRT